MCLALLTPSSDVLICHLQAPGATCVNSLAVGGGLDTSAALLADQHDKTTLGFVRAVGGAQGLAADLVPS